MYNKLIQLTRFKELIYKTFSGSLILIKSQENSKYNFELTAQLEHETKLYESNQKLKLR